jgi:hypothetical protein
MNTDYTPLTMVSPPGGDTDSHLHTPPETGDRLSSQTKGDGVAIPITMQSPLRSSERLPQSTYLISLPYVLIPQSLKFVNKFKNISWFPTIIQPDIEYCYMSWILLLHVKCHWRPFIDVIFHSQSIPSYHSITITRRLINLPLPWLSKFHVSCKHSYHYWLVLLSS